MVNKALMSSVRDDWETPADLFLTLNRRWGFEIDAAASEANAKAKIFFTKEQDGLTRDWSGITWVNPPYGRVVGQWVKKGLIESSRWGVPVVMLLAARTDTLYFHNYIMKAAEIFFIKGRLRFVGSLYPAPFPSMIVVFDSVHAPRPNIYTMTTNGEIIGSP